MAERSRRLHLGGRGERSSGGPSIRQADPQHLALLRLDLEALWRGHVEGDELCEITGLGPIPVGRRQGAARRRGAQADHHQGRRRRCTSRASPGAAPRPCTTPRCGPRPPARWRAAHARGSSTTIALVPSGRTPATPPRRARPYVRGPPRAAHEQGLGAGRGHRQAPDGPPRGPAPSPEPGPHNLVSHR